MASLNKIQLIGNLGQDPEVRYTASGSAVCNLSVATTYSTKDQNGERKEETEWHRVTTFNRLAEIAGEYLKKGRSVYIEGRLRTRKWQDQNGQDRYTTEIIADQMQMLGSRDDGGQQPQKQQQKQSYQAQGGGLADIDDDIPFAPYLSRKAYIV